MQIRGSQLKSFCEDTTFLNGETKFMYQIANDEYIIGQTSGKIFTLKENKVTPFIQLENKIRFPSELIVEVSGKTRYLLSEPLATAYS